MKTILLLLLLLEIDIDQLLLFLLSARVFYSRYTNKGNVKKKAMFELENILLLVFLFLLRLE